MSGVAAHAGGMNFCATAWKTGIASSFAETAASVGKSAIEITLACASLMKRSAAATAMGTENQIRTAILGGMDPQEAYLKFGKF